MAFNTYSDIQLYAGTIYDDAMFAARENGFMASLVLNFGNQSGLAPRIGKEYGTASFSQIGETDDLSSQAWNPSNMQTLTPAEWGAQFFMTDSRLESDPEGYRSDAALELGLGLAESINNNILGDFSSLTGGTIGDGTGTITWGNFFAARSLLRAQKAPPPYVCVLHEYQWHRLASAVTPAAASAPVASWVTDSVLTRWYVANIADVSIFTTSDITIDGSTVAYGALFSPSALALDMRRSPRLEPERDASRRGWELNMTSVYAHGIWRPKFGVQLKTLTTTPS